MADPADPRSASLPRVSRRTFLAGASAIAATPVLAGLVGSIIDGGDRIEFEGLGLAALSVGYVEGTDARAQAGTMAWTATDLGGARVVPAAGLRNGDSSLAGRVVRVSIHGLYPSRAALPATARTVSVNALFASRQPNAPYAFYAWTLRPEQEVTLSHRSSFNVALDRNPRFGIALDVATTTGPATAAAVFATGGGAGLAKLRAGTYLLAVAHDRWDRPSTLPAAGDKAWERLASIVVTVDPAVA